VYLIFREFFEECDGILLNYGWRQDNLANSKYEAQLSGRQFDVYVGVDVFGRGCFGGGGFNTKEVCIFNTIMFQQEFYSKFCYSKIRKYFHNGYCLF